MKAGGAESEGNIGDKPLVNNDTTATLLAAPPGHGLFLAPPIVQEIIPAALALAWHGLPVVPVYRLERGVEGSKCACAKGTACDTPGKHPRGSDWGPKATLDRAQIDKWWRTTPHNLGVVVPEGWIVLDPDARNGGPALLEEMEQGSRVETWTDWNGTDEGRHYWYRLPAGYQGPRPAYLTGRDGAKLDLLWPGHLVIMPPSAHPNGGNRAWIVAPSAPPAEVPAWLLDRVLLSAPASGAHTPGPRTPLPPEAAAMLAKRGPREYDPQAILAACGGTWRAGGLEATMRCPSHADTNPSAALKIAPGGRVLWHCYAGCDQATLTQAIRAIPGALIPRPLPLSPVRPRGRVYIHRRDLRDLYAAGIEVCDATLLPSNPPGGNDWALDRGAVYGIEDRPRLWAEAVRKCSTYARGARADCEAGEGRVYFAGFIQCRFKACPVCSASRLMRVAHEHDALWKAAGVTVLDVWCLNGPTTTRANAMRAGNAALRAWRQRGHPGAALAAASVLRTVNLEASSAGRTDQARAEYLIAVPAGTPVEGWAGPVEQIAAGVGFDEVHEAQIAAWGAMLDQVREAEDLAGLLEALPRGARLLEPLGGLRAEKDKVRTEERAAAAAEGVTVAGLRAARRPQGARCPWHDGSHPITDGRYLLSAGRNEGGVEVLAWPAKAAHDPPLRAPHQLGVEW